MKIKTQSDKLMQLRRGVIDLYVSDHPLVCDTCPADQHCELQDMAAEVGITESSYAKGATHWPETPADVSHDNSNPYFGFNPELCIVCSRCVRACDEVQGTFALTIDLGKLGEVGWLVVLALAATLIGKLGVGVFAGRLGGFNVRQGVNAGAALVARLRCGSGRTAD